MHRARATLTHPLGFGRALLCAGALAALLAAPAAQAQSTSTGAAESLFNDGRELMDKGDFAAACEKFAASHALEASVGALLNLGDCREKNGQPASAWVAYKQAANMARREGDKRRLAFAERRAAAIEPKLSYMVVEVPSERRVDAMSIELGDEILEEPLWGQRAPVDPGEHVIVVTAPGYEPRKVTVSVAPGGDTVTVTIPLLEPKPDARPGASGSTAMPGGEVNPGESGPGGTAGLGGPGPGPGRDQPAGILTGGRYAAIGLGVVGVAGVATGIAFAMRSQSKWDKGQLHCNELNQCDEEGIALAREAADSATVSNISYGVGAACLVGGAALWFLSPPAERGDNASASAGGRPRPLAITPLFGPQGTGVLVEGSF
ncbi:hypothetical protein [Haliangium sp.]|uniref:hypothetical protein n=1 Tax=Haliangium sp. TaxID=2663208 RepID=UPI003D12CD5A